MANKKKKISPLVKAKRRYRRNKSRLDMRKGGRVSKQFGGVNIPNVGNFQRKPDESDADYRDRLGISTQAGSLANPHTPSTTEYENRRGQQGYGYGANQYASGTTPPQGLGAGEKPPSQTTYTPPPPPPPPKDEDTTGEDTTGDESLPIDESKTPYENYQAIMKK